MLTSQALATTGQTFAAIQRDNHEKFLKGQQEMGMSWKKRVFGIGPDNKIMPASRMIYPLSPFGVSCCSKASWSSGFSCSASTSAETGCAQILDDNEDGIVKDCASARILT
jgi:hypothetical protein